MDSGWGWDPSSKMTPVRLVRPYPGYSFSPPQHREKQQCPSFGVTPLPCSSPHGPAGLEYMSKEAKRRAPQELACQPVKTGETPFADASVMSADCCFSLLKGTSSSPDWPITLTLAAPFPHQYTPEALITLAKQR